MNCRIKILMKALRKITQIWESIDLIQHTSRKVMAIRDSYSAILLDKAKTDEHNSTDNLQNFTWYKPRGTDVIQSTNTKSNMSVSEWCNSSN